MRVYTFADFSEKEVINCNDGRRLGFPCDIKFDAECGKILSVCVKDSSPLSLFGKSGCDVTIPWECIDKIGDDIIIVNMTLPLPPPCKDKKKKGSLFG